MEGQIRMAKQTASIKIERELPTEETILWKFTHTEAATKLRWKHAREFEYQGEMYDIIRSETIGDTMLYWCYHDRKETKLRKDLSVLLKSFVHKDPQHAKQQTHITTFITSLICVHIDRWGIPMMTHRKEEPSTTDIGRPLNPFIRPPVPPPKNT
jgi:hypothetical protein